MSAEFVEEFYRSHAELGAYLLNAKELTYATDFNTTFRRSLVLAIASFFEHEVTTVLREIPLRHAPRSAFIAAAFERQVITRKYHTYFDWDNLKPGQFFILFGDGYKELARVRMRQDPLVGAAVASFLELGQTRNKLVHQNFVSFAVDKTPEELIVQFRAALPFVAFLRETLLSRASTRFRPGRGWNPARQRLSVRRIKRG